MTYRERIQGLLRKINEVYDEAEALRDYADLDEKYAWNGLRGSLHEPAGFLQKLDRQLSDDRAQMETF